MELKEAIQQRILEALKKIGLQAHGVLLEHPADLAHGDYATSAALKHAKEANLSARALAERLLFEIGEIPGVTNISIAGSGFLNFHLAPSVLAGAVRDATSNDMWGQNARLRGKKIMIEYTDPNPFKEFHVGHLMSNAIGESISRLLEFSSAEIQRVNYQGDIGPHVAKALWGLQRLALDPSNARDLGAAYAEGSRSYEADPNAKIEIDAINRKIYDKSDSSLNELYARGREASLQHFEELYAVLGTKFDHYFFESETAVKGLEIVNSHPDTFEKSDGATVYKGEKVGLHTRVFITGNGLPTYETKELGLAEEKAARWPSDRSITITGNEQKEYFQVVLAALREVDPPAASKIEHITHGMMRLPEGKMSSRTGNVISGESLLSELKERARERAAGSRSEDVNALAEQVAVAAVKYQILKQASGRDIIFDKELALSLEGDSGPYLQYAHTRAHAIVEKARTQNIIAEINNDAAPSDVARLLLRFPEVVEYAANELEPHLLTTYLLEFAAVFNRWYANEQILDGTPAAAHKVAVVDAVRRTLKNGLWLLGIPTPERM